MYMRVVLTGGGTGGHIFPALALARYIQEVRPEAEILYIGTEKGLEHDIVPKAGFAFRTVEARGLKRKLGLDTFRTFAAFRRGLKQTKQILREFQPDVVVGTGGYVCAPVVYSAAKMNIPTIIHEQNAIPGLTNKLLARYVSVVAVSFPSTEVYFKRAKRVVISGNPRASEVKRLPGDTARSSLRSLQLDESRKTVLVFGGSRGARPINEAVLGMLRKVERDKAFQLIFITGQIHYEQVMEACKREGIGHSGWVSIQPFVYDMPKLLSAVDLIVCRAGATTLAELTAIGVPCILIPSPYVANNHQYHNAKWIADHGAGIMMEEANLTSERLYQKIVQIASDDEYRSRMAEKSRELGYPQSAEILYRTLEHVIQGETTRVV
jgi:UDP-N-acetylglucosamine--N-acetylmuramyl-(pentapeptide) pyrophosphoryl-undecaprenol N-acetylglucosamine transferase